MNTHRAVIETSVPPKLHPIAAGPKDFCEEYLAKWIESHPLGEFETALVLAVEPQTIDPNLLAEAKAALETEPANAVEAHHKEVIRELLARIDRLERGPKVLDFPQRIDVTREAYVEGTVKVRELINNAVNSGATAAVYVQPLEGQ